MNNIRIAIDGPAGAGKSTIAKKIARSVGIVYLDTGAMYRAVGLEAIRESVDLKDNSGLSELVKNIDINVVYNNGEQSITISGEDVSGKIRTPEVSKAASLVAAVPEVRLKLVELQRQIAAKQSVVMDGRDIGTYVLPDAEVKIFLTATVAERARRRYEELLDKGMTVSLDEIAKDIKQRDYNDSTRAFAPLKKADDAVEIDTTALTIDEVVEKVKALAWKRMGKC